MRRHWVFFGLAKRKLSALQAGADFDLIYGVTAQSSTAPALYSILDDAGATAGRVTGLYSPGQLQLYLYSNTARTTETSGDNFFTDVYIDADQTFFNAGQLYRTLAAVRCPPLPAGRGPAARLDAGQLHLPEPAGPGVGRADRSDRPAADERLLLEA